MNPYDITDKKVKWFLGRISQEIDFDLTNPYTINADGSNEAEPQARKMSEVSNAILGGYPKDDILNKISEENLPLLEQANYVDGTGAFSDGRQEKVTDAVLNGNIGIDDAIRYFNIESLKSVQTKSGATAYEIEFNRNIALNYDEFGSLDDTDNFKKTYVNQELGDKILEKSLQAISSQELDQDDIATFLGKVHDGKVADSDNALLDMLIVADSHRNCAPDVPLAVWMTSSDYRLDIEYQMQSMNPIDGKEYYDAVPTSVSGLKGVLVNNGDGKTAVNLDTVDFDADLKVNDGTDDMMSFYYEQSKNALSIGEDVISSFKPTKANTYVPPKKHVLSQQWGDNLLEL